MSSRFAPYPDYQMSDVSWLGRIPTHWTVTRAKNLFYESNELSISGEEEQLSVSHMTGVTSRSEKNVTMFKAESYVGHKICQPNDLVINTMWAWMGALGVSRIPGIVSPSYGVYRPKDVNLIHAQYYDSMLRTPHYVAEYVRRSTGIHSSRLRLYPDEFLRMPLLFPPLEEQTQIAKFLDYETAKIDALIAKQQQLIALLQEKRQAVISHAVTKGLNPAAPLRDSGVEWLGQVPAHWRICCIKHIISPKRNSMVDGPFGSSVNTELDYVAVGVPVIRTVNITNNGFSSDNLKFMREAKFEQLKRHAVYPGDVLFSKVGTIGNACLLPQSIPEAILSTTGSCKITVNTDKCLAEFLVLCIQSMYEELMQIANSNVQPFLNMVNIKNLKLPLPSTSEQNDILVKLKSDLRRLDAVIDKAGRSAELLQERRTALISAAVTGKIDVRGWQPPVANPAGAPP